MDNLNEQINYFINSEDKTVFLAVSNSNDINSLLNVQEMIKDEVTADQVFMGKKPIRVQGVNSPVILAETARLASDLYYCKNFINMCIAAGITDDLTIMPLGEKLNEKTRSRW
jgi:hypothetical protein